MVDLHRDADALARTQARLDEVEALLTRSATTLDEAAEVAPRTGSVELQARIGELVEHLEGALRSGRDYTGTTSAMVGAVRARFDEVEADLGAGRGPDATGGVR